MAFLSKAESLDLAKELGIENAEELAWKELQAAIAAKQKEPADIPVEAVGDPTESKTAVRLQKRPLFSEYMGRTVMISPEMPPERYRLLKYDEELGDDIELVERRFDMNMATDEVFDISGESSDTRHQLDASHDYRTGTYRYLGKNGRKVVAMSSVPKENYGSGIRPFQDYAPIVTWNGRSGYLWTHHAYPNIKALLMESGYYHEYKHLFTREPNIWYVAGKTLACDIGLVHRIFNEIEAKEKRKREEENAYRRGLGL